MIDSIGSIRIAMTRNSTKAGWTATTSVCGIKGRVWNTMTNVSR
jgi:hypothetical protein